MNMHFFENRGKYFKKSMLEPAPCSLCSMNTQVLLPIVKNGRGQRSTVSPQGRVWHRVWPGSGCQCGNKAGEDAEGCGEGRHLPAGRQLRSRKVVTAQGKSFNEAENPFLDIRNPLPWPPAPLPKNLNNVSINLNKVLNLKMQVRILETKYHDFILLSNDGKLTPECVSLCSLALTDDTIGLERVQWRVINRTGRKSVLYRLTSKKTRLWPSEKDERLDVTCQRCA